MEIITNTLYTVQNRMTKPGEWRTYATFSNRSHADDCMHRTGTYEGLPPLITSKDPHWRIVQVDTVERSTVVTTVRGVWDDQGLVVS